MKKIFLVTEHSTGEGYDDIRDFAYSYKGNALEKMHELIEAAKEDMGVDENICDGHFEICDNDDYWECYDNYSYDTTKIYITPLVIEECAGFKDFVNECEWLGDDVKKWVTEDVALSDGLPIEDVVKLLGKANKKLSEISHKRIYLTLDGDILQVRIGKVGSKPSETDVMSEAGIWDVENKIKETIGEILIGC